MTWLAPFRCCFQERTWQRVLVLLVGTLLARGPRTVKAALRHMGQQDDPHFSSYHQVFNRASWSLAQASHVLFSLLLRAFCAQEQRLVITLDETLERRWGPKINLADLYHDAVRSTHRFTYCTHDLRWLVAALVVEVPWTKQRYALPFLTHFAPSPAISQQLGRRHKTAVWLVRMIDAESHSLRLLPAFSSVYGFPHIVSTPLDLLMINALALLLIGLRWPSAGSGLVEGHSG